MYLRVCVLYFRVGPAVRPAAEALQCSGDCVILSLFTVFRLQEREWGVSKEVIHRISLKRGNQERNHEKCKDHGITNVFDWNYASLDKGKREIRNPTGAQSMEVLQYSILRKQSRKTTH